MQLATISGAGATHPYAWAVVPPAPPCPALPRAPAQLPEKDLPLAIQRACTRVQFWRAGPFEALKARDRAVLAEVVRCVDRQRPQQPVHVRRDTLADREGCSVPTITRALARLAGLGWIRRDQVKSRVRGFQVGSVELSAEAIAWLGLLEAAERAPAAPSPAPPVGAAPRKALRESPVIDASRSSGIQCIHRQPPAGGYVEQARPSSHRKARPGQLPDGLQWLERCRISRHGVFLLMRLARQRGVLLETVVNLCRSQIEAATLPFAYVRDLLARDKDWAWVAQSRADGQHAQAQDAARQAAREALQQRLSAVAGRWWLAPTKRQLLRQEGGVFMVYTLGEDGRAGTSLGARTDVEVVLAAIDAGKLVAW